MIKNNNITHVISHLMRNLLCLSALLLVISCQKEQINIDMGKDRVDEDNLENSSVSLRSMSTSQNTVYCLLTEGKGALIEGLKATTNRPSSFDQTVLLEADPSLTEAYAAEKEIDYEPLPPAFYSFENGGSFQLTAGETSSAPTRLTLYSTSPVGNRLKAGRYLLPVVATASSKEVSRDVIYYDIIVREPFEGDAELYTGEDVFFVFYLNTSQYDPRLVTDYYFEKSNQSTSDIIWYNAVGNIINLRKATVTYDNSTGRALLHLSSDMKYVLNHYSKYILPVQETGRKVCLSIEGGNTGLGFCNMTDGQIADFVNQIKILFENYDLDGVNLWDRNSGYGEEKMPPMNTTSYPKLIKALREMLGPEKLLTITDHKEPTEYFWDLEATGGIKVGEYLDYAWSGYCDANNPNEIIDPYAPEAPGVSKVHIRKPIPGLGSDKYGCVNAPWEPSNKDKETEAIWNTSWDNLSKWTLSGNKKNNIFVCEDIRTHLQDAYEYTWTNFFALWYLESDSFVNSPDNGHSYWMEKVRLTDFGEAAGYGKWLKDW